MKIGEAAAWSREEIEAFLQDTRWPVRVAANAPSGFPTVCSVWFEYEAGALHCATQREARLAKLLERDSRCGFEVAPNEPPYFGVRGRARARIASDAGPEQLDRLLERYLRDSDAGLGRWLRSRADREVELILEVDWITAWDYRNRMAAGK